MSSRRERVNRVRTIKGELTAVSCRANSPHSLSLSLSHSGQLSLYLGRVRRHGKGAVFTAWFWFPLVNTPQFQGIRVTRYTEGITTSQNKNVSMIFPFATEMKSGSSADTITETWRNYTNVFGREFHGSESTKLGAKRNTKGMNLHCWMSSGLRWKKGSRICESSRSLMSCDLWEQSSSTLPSMGVKKNSADIFLWKY